MLWQSIALCHIANPTASYDILPDVLPTFASGVNMVNALRPSFAVLTKIVITSEYSFTVQGGTSPVRGANVITKASYRWGKEFKFFGAHHVLTFMNDLRLISQQQKKCSPHRDDRQGPISNVQN
jgi:hypothetical protein